MKQNIFENNFIDELVRVAREDKVKNIFLVSGKSFLNSKNFEDLSNALSCFGKLTVFSDFKPNPVIEDAMEGKKRFIESKSDIIVAIGGGSAIDTAKCIKYYSEKLETKLIAIPTTAGTGSESTRFAVIYDGGEKQSVHSDDILPDIAILDGKLLKDLPTFQRKATLMDALCQAIESYWSCKSNDESKALSKEAIKIIMANWKEYIFMPNSLVDEMIIRGANLAGQAINITTTTAPHALSYKLTSTYNIPHGYAVSLTLPHIYRFMYENPDNLSDLRGKDYLLKTLDEIANIMGFDGAIKAISGFNEMLSTFEFFNPKSTGDRDKELEYMASKVNVERLSNNPVKLTTKDIFEIYSKVVD